MFEFLLFVVFLVLLIAFAYSQRTQIDELKRRVDQLERAASRTPEPVVRTEVEARPAVETPRPESTGPPSPEPPWLEPMSPAPSRKAEPAPAPSPAPAPTSATRRPITADRLEEIVGSVWLQNLGAVLLLIGVFFLIVWGWTTGRFGPEVLVASGVVIGALLVWRGHHLRRSLEGLGNAFIGIGLGVAYLTLYLGHFNLRVLPGPIAIGALLAVSAFALLAGLHYRVQTIAALGVIGAYLPQLLSGLLHIPGYSLAAPMLLAWIAAVSVLVFALTARAGWSALDLTALGFACVTWVASQPGGAWGWPVTIGLAVMFAALGLAPLPRLVRNGGPVLPTDLAVVSAAPLAFAITAWPMLAREDSRLVAVVLFGFAAVETAAAFWVDTRRPDRDLWRPLTGAASVLLAAALERALGPEWTPLAWSVEGALLVWLSLAPGSGWLRVSGTLALAIASVWALAQVVPAIGYPSSVMSAVAIRTLAIVVVLFVTSALLARHRGELTFEERYAPEMTLGAGHLILMLWFAAEAHSFSGWLGGRDVRFAAPWGTPLMLALMALGWVGQATWLAWSGTRTRRVVTRVMGWALAVVATFVSLAALWMARDPWSRAWWPILHPIALLQLAAIVLMFVSAARLASHREALNDLDRRSPEIWAVLGAVVLMSWTSREADHVARAVLALPGMREEFSSASDALRRLRALAPVFTSVGWLIQALLTMAIGWWRRSAFLRWMGLALVGLTALKFVLRDLVGADPFWRFLTAIAAGATMLAMSWLYQRMKREREVVRTAP